MEPPAFPVGCCLMAAAHASELMEPFDLPVSAASSRIEHRPASGRHAPIVRAIPSSTTENIPLGEGLLLGSMDETRRARPPGGAVAPTRPMV